ncbi:MAG: hypothetical protein JSV25_07425, partial [Spirochaetota bacterium]
YDSNNNQYSVLNGNLSDIPKGVVTNSKDFPESRITLTIKGLVVMKQMDIQNAGLILIALYPYKIGGAAVQLFGLIGVLILTILLVSFALYFSFQSFKKKGVVAMREEEKADIIDEIDKELSGIGEEEGKPARESHPEKKEKDEALKKLEDDGIFINE